MGTCLSKKQSSTGATKKKRSLKQNPAVAAPPPSLSPPLPEEETVVKEVLTETPMPSSATTRSNSRRAPEDATAKAPGEGEGTAAAAAAAGGDGSEEASEICSASECLSASTALTEKISVGAEEVEAGEEETSAPPKWWPPEWSSPAGKGCYPHQRRRSDSDESPVRREPRAGAGGGVRSSPSPARRPDGRLFTGNGNAAAGTWKGHGDRSGGRSVSPAVKRARDPRAGGGGGGAGVGRSTSMRKTGAASPRRARPAPAGSAVRRAVASAGEGVEEALLPSRGQKESMENPLVSLECFIFL